MMQTETTEAPPKPDPPDPHPQYPHWRCSCGHTLGYKVTLERNPMLMLLGETGVCFVSSAIVYCGECGRKAIYYEDPHVLERRYMAMERRMRGRK